MFKTTKMNLALVMTACTLCVFQASVASEKSLNAHEHGAVKMALALDANSIEIDLDGPAESFLGFEYAPKSPKEKKIFDDLHALWTKKLSELISFDKKLNCQVTSAQFAQSKGHGKGHKGHAKKENGVHSEIEATAKLNCAGNPAGSEVVLSLRKSFPNIKKLSVEILGTETKSIEITKATQTLKL